MSLDALGPPILRELESELQRQVKRLDHPHTGQFHEMLTYHLGWSGAAAGQNTQGKRIRPLLLLLSTVAAGGEWQPALPAGAAVELVHNFSLVHDDIQDDSPKRHGRPTVWKNWGVPMAINAGDALFVMAHLAVLDLSGHFPPATVLAVARLLQETCLELTRGQFLDMSYEKRAELSVSDYWPMIAGKTAALIAACAQIGAILGGADETLASHYRTFGWEVGLAFQVQDDLLGIWGDEGRTGKSVSTDLVEGKNSLPVLFALGQKRRFAARWAGEPIQPEEVPELTRLLAEEGAREHAQDEARRLTARAHAALEEANPQGPAGSALAELADMLLNRKS
jgi:geranylgeranyl diphosphate synthase type I